MLLCRIKFNGLWGSAVIGSGPSTLAETIFIVWVLHASCQFCLKILLASVYVRLPALCILYHPMNLDVESVFDYHLLLAFTYTSKHYFLPFYHLDMHVQTPLIFYK